MDVVRVKVRVGFGRKVRVRVKARFKISIRVSMEVVFCALKEIFWSGLRDPKGV